MEITINTTDEDVFVATTGISRTVSLSFSGYNTFADLTVSEARAVAAALLAAADAMSD